MIELTRKLPPKVVRETMTELDKVLVKLTADCRQWNNDFEVAHYDADTALLYVIDLLKPLVHPDLWLSLDHIKAAYEEVGKWYA